MLNSEDFYKCLLRNGIDFFTGVPDSVLKNFSSFILDHAPKEKNITAANEGNAVALAAGYHLSTGKYGLVYMQNSGLGNAINPLVSLADKDVYGIPVLLLIGWRGEPGIKDEPQHVKQGRITLKMLDTLEIPYEILSDDPAAVEKSIQSAAKRMKDEKSSFALVVRKGLFRAYPKKEALDVDSELYREDAIKLICKDIESRSIIISSTGKISRELYEIRDIEKTSHEKDFLTIGSMGHCSQIALSIALNKPNRSVYCLDCDGSVIMHMGSLAINGSMNADNFKHIIFNNAAHESVGGQATVGAKIDFCAIALSCGYKKAFRVRNKSELFQIIKEMSKESGPVLLEIMVKKGSRQDLGRPKETAVMRKHMFMDNLARGG